ncbi:hypothetical protein ACRS9C_11445 [Serratia marcescens]|uniref:hypothetical protein n=1 Tax=Serratia marcescens TaxID=615 RepID=UPI003EE10995
MSEQVQIGVKVEKTLKDGADAILRCMGIKPTTAIAALYHYIVQHRELPFIIKTHVTRSNTLLFNLFMDYTLLTTSLDTFYFKLEKRTPILDNEVASLKHILREFSTNYRQLEKPLGLLSDDFPVDWKRAFNGARRAFYVLEAYLQSDEQRGYYLEDSELLKLSMALKMLREAEIST